MKLVSWNIARRRTAWEMLASDHELDVALLQEANAPPPELDLDVVQPEGDFRTGGGPGRYWRTAIVKCSDRVEVQPVPLTTLEEAAAGAVPVSLDGSLSVAIVRGESIEPFYVVSAYSAWESPVSGGWILADTSAHRLISDLSALITRQGGHRIIVAGDWNLVYDLRPPRSTYWPRREGTVFDRMTALGLPLVGPRHPNGRKAVDPLPSLPDDSLNVPTYYTRSEDAVTARNQLDYVFASEALHPVLLTRARNDPGDWGPSDHCRIEIEVSG